MVTAPGAKPETEIAVSAMARHCCGLLRQRLDRLETRSGLVAGCGAGDEVVYLRRAFRSARIVGVDLESTFSPRARRESCLAVGDILRLPFPTAGFDFAAAIHSLEHVADPAQALAELQRVLRDGGWLYLGVPNRSRWVGYLGSFDATAWQKLTWNLKDYGARLRGRFRNEAGAHAGFEAEELVTMLRACFESVELLTESYLRFKYGGRLPEPLLDFLLAPGLINHSAPAHYALCRKKV